MDPARLHILVVDDSVDTADSTVELLCIWGYDARARYCGATALEFALSFRPCVVLVDVAMPGMDGFQFADLFREMPLCKVIPIIALSGYSGAAYSARARESGIQHYLLKPADPDRLRELLALEVVPVADLPQWDRTDCGNSLRKPQVGTFNAQKCGATARFRRARSAACQTVAVISPSRM